MEGKYYTRNYIRLNTLLLLKIPFAVQRSTHIPADKPHQKITFLNRAKQGISPLPAKLPESFNPIRKNFLTE
ncbi:MAG TPA: hypothetical protein VJ000_02370 [Thermodesulfovibrionia bacterium]|nr:MAG: hypothetical protein A3G70_05500 [Planctomycetes bacterium RIFCSPLOWO2_12_FULL_39_13]HLA50019.1 hypothetical protein [Thermodesulfovibrionia bacterium]